MNNESGNIQLPGAENPTGMRELLKEVIREFHETSAAKSEPVYKAELTEERRRRESLEARVRELEEENRTTQRRAEEADRNASIRAELQRLGVTKVDLAYRVVKDDVFRSDSGELRAKQGNMEIPLKDYLTGFVSSNPEFLPARIHGGSGASVNAESNDYQDRGVRLDVIRPGMNPEELKRVRMEVARLAQEQVKGI